ARRRRAPRTARRCRGDLGERHRAVPGRRRGQVRQRGDCSSMRASFERIGGMPGDLIDYYPELTAVLVLVFGFVLGRVAEASVRHALVLADRLAARYGTRREGLFSPVFQRACALLAQGIVLVVAIILAVRL